MHGPYLLGLLTVLLYLYGEALNNTYMATHETVALYLRPYQYLREWRAGFPHPLLFPDACYGAGMAFPVFYPPLGLVTAALCEAVAGERVFLGCHVALVLSVLVSAVTAYLCTAWIAPGRPALAGLCALIYTTSIYRFVLLFVRGATAEAWFLAWAPLVVLGGCAALRRSRASWVLPVGVAGAILSHTVMTLYLALVCAAIFLPPLLASRDWRTALRTGALAVLGAGLAGFYLVPQQAYLSSVWVYDKQLMIAAPDYVQKHAVHWAQLFRMNPDTWYNNSTHLRWGEMSFATGLGQWLAITVVVGLSAWILSQPTRVQLLQATERAGMRLRVFSGEGHTARTRFQAWASRTHLADVAWGLLGLLHSGWKCAPTAIRAMGQEIVVLGRTSCAFLRRSWRTRQAPPEHAWMAIGALAAWVFCMAFMVNPAAFLHRLPQPFGYIQFPWRVLGLAPLPAIVAFALAWRNVPAGGRATVACVVASALLVFTIPEFARQARPRPELSADALLDRELVWQQGVHGFVADAEYLPSSAPNPRENLTRMAAPAVPDGVHLVRWETAPDGHRKVLEVKAGRRESLVVPIASYPFWNAHDQQGRPVALADRNGYLEVEVSPGHSTITFFRTYTAPFKAGWAITLGSCAALLLLAFPRLRPRL